MFRLSTLRSVASALNVAPWKLAVLGAALVSGAVAVTVVAAGLFLVIMPAVLLAVGIAALLAPRRRAQVPVVVRSGPQVIEVDYEIIEPRERR
jgi:uncharacterized membrane protein